MPKLSDKLRDPHHWCAMRKFTDIGYQSNIDESPEKAADLLDECERALEKLCRHMETRPTIFPEDDGLRLLGRTTLAKLRGDAQ